MQGTKFRLGCGQQLELSFVELL
uniref:Uncharacterized protein n=1 Tax=Rhizophora mucronata TaxID=61149 RepID=A0A2P2Q4A8_RHIMU